MTNIPPDDTPRKYCAKCKELLPTTSEFFSRSKNDKSGWYSYCKACCHTEWLAKHPNKYEAPQGYKQCRKCRENLPLANFSHNKNRNDELQSYCRDCIKQHIKDNQAEVNERRKQYRKANREVFLERDKKFRETHRESRREQNRQSNERHQDYVREHYRQYAQSEHGREVRRTLQHKRNAKKKAVEGTLTPKQIQAKLQAQNYRCYYAACGFAKFEKRNSRYIFHLEHTVPLSRTEYSPRHDVNFVVLSCPSCNMKKNNKLPHEWEGSGRLF